MTFCGSLTAKSTGELLHALKASHPQNLHVPDRCAIRDRQRRGAFAVKLDKLTNYFSRAQQLGDVQNEIGRGDAFAQLSA